MWAYSWLHQLEYALYQLSEVERSIGVDIHPLDGLADHIHIHLDGLEKPADDDLFPSHVIKPRLRKASRGCRDPARRTECWSPDSCNPWPSPLYSGTTRRRRTAHSRSACPYRGAGHRG